MITATDFYHVMTAMVPLYVAMFLAHVSVRWWKVFTPDQCAGINRFVALFAVPFLSFHFISANNLYKMDLRFIAADTIQKLVILALLTIWANLTKKGSLDWSITLFSLCTLPNTLVIGIPLLGGMYGAFTASLMTQIVVLQCVIWYTFLLFLYEFRGAKLLIYGMFPGAASSISAIDVDSDVVSLDGSQPLETNIRIKDDGSLHVTVRRSNVSHSDIVSKRLRTPANITPVSSNLSNTEIFSLHSSRYPTPRGSSFNNPVLPGRNSSFGALDSNGFSARHSNFEDDVGRARSQHFPATNHGQNGRHDVEEAKLAAPPTFPEKAILEGQDYTHESENLGDGEPNSLPPAGVMIKLILIMVWRKLIRNPNTYASVLGLTWSLVSFRWNLEMPAIVAKSISILSDTGLGMAMFSLGLFMALQPKVIACGKPRATLAMVVRFLVGPGIMAASSAAVGLRGVLLQVAIVQAALPQGIVTFVYAKEYNVHADILSTSVIIGMLVAVPIALLYYIVLAL